jgi:hypothetical protein
MFLESFLTAKPSDYDWDTTHKRCIALIMLQEKAVPDGARLTQIGLKLACYSGFMTRLIVILLVCLAGFFVACKPDIPQDKKPDVTIRIRSNGIFTAWRVVSVEGADDVALLDTDDTPWTLKVGKRYKIVNNQGTEHPLNLLNSGGDALLKQLGGGDTGLLESDPEIDFVRVNNGFIFTATSSLAAQLSSYICALHPDMTGFISVE